MLEQKTFHDDKGTAWYNRPGPKQGLPVWLIPLSSLIPGTILMTLTSTSLLIGGGIALIYTLGLFGLWGLISIRLLGNQTCPQCQTSKVRGYEKCSGCGYPYS